MRRLNDPRGYYAALGVAPGCDDDEIGRAFKRRAKEVHPDHSRGERAEIAFHQLFEAYRVLRDPRRRRAYDAAGGRSPRVNGAAPDMQDAAGRTAGSNDTATPPQDQAREAGSLWSRHAADMASLARRITPAGAAMGAVILAGLLLAVYQQNRLDLQRAEIAGLGRRLETARGDLLAMRARYRDDFFARVGVAVGNLSGERFLLRADIRFEAGSTELSAEAGRDVRGFVGELASVVALIPEERMWTIRIDGHASRPGGDAGLLAAGWEEAMIRALAVADALVDGGVPDTRIAVSAQMSSAVGAAGGEPPADGVVALKLVCCA